MNENTFFKIIPFSKFETWDVKQYFKTEIISLYKVEKLEQHIYDEKIKKELKENEKYGILEISNETGLFDAYEKFGKDLKKVYKIVEDNCIAYNPYRINDFAVGIKTTENKFSLIDSKYIVIRCKETILPEYLYIIMKSRFFNKMLSENQTGITIRLSFEILKNIKIPIPPIDVQKQIIEYIMKQIDMIKKLNIKIEEERVNIEKYIGKKVGITENFEEKNSSILRIEKFSNILKWDVWNKEDRYLLKNNDLLNVGKMLEDMKNCKSEIEQIKQIVNDELEKRILS